MAEVIGYKFRIYRATNSTGPYTKIAEITGNDCSYDDQDVTAGQIYYYKLATVDTESGMESVWTDPVSCIASGATPPSIPVGLTVTDNNGLVALNWNDSQAGDNPISNYKVWRSEDSVDYHVIGEPLESQYADLFVTPGLTYYYYVSSVDIENLESDPCAPISTTVQGVVLEAPTIQGLAGADAIKLKWNQVDGAIQYKIYKNNSLIGSTNENYFIYITTDHATYSYTVRAIDEYNHESSDSNSVSLASSAPSATITFPATSPYNITSPTIKIEGQSQPGFSLEYVELQIISSATEYTRASLTQEGSNWQATLTLNSGNYTISARAKSIAGNLSGWSTSKIINVSPAHRVYKFVNNNWEPVDQAANVRVHREINKVSTASFTLPTKSIEMKDKISIQGEGIKFLGRVLTRNNSESDFWDYTCVDESYALQKIPLNILTDKSWESQGNINQILRSLFATLQDEGYITFGVEATSTYTYDIDCETLKGKDAWSILSRLSSVSSDIFYFDSSLGKLVFKPKTPASGSPDLVYGQNISGWKVEEHRENIINFVSLRGMITTKILATDNITKNYMLGVYPAEEWNYDIYWNTLKKVGIAGLRLPKEALKICSDLYTQSTTTGFIGLRIPLPPLSSSTINFSVPIKKKGNPPNLKVYIYQIPTGGWGAPELEDYRYPLKEFTFDKDSFIQNEEKFCSFSIGVDTKPSAGTYFPIWLFIIFALPETYAIEDNDYYSLRWVKGGWGNTTDMISNFAINRIDGRLVVPVVGGDITYSEDTEYWTTTPGSIFKYPIGESKVVLLGGRSIERSFNNYTFEDYWGILAKFAGSALLELYYDNNPTPVRRLVQSIRPDFFGEGAEGDEIKPYILLFSSQANWLQDYIAAGFSSTGVHPIPVFLNQSPPAGAKLKKLKFIALSPYVHFTELKLVGKEREFWVSKKITDYDPSSTSITDYGLCPDPDSGQEKEFSSKIEMEEYIKNILLTQSNPQFSLSLSYPHILIPSLPSTFNITIPEIQTGAFSQKVIGCEWDLDMQTTTLIFETAPLNYVIQALKSLKDKQ